VVLAAAVLMVGVTACKPPTAPAAQSDPSTSTSAPVTTAPATTAPATTAPVTTAPVTTQPGSPKLLDCPVTGSHYTSNSFGPKPGGGFHYGTDMLAPTGTQERAVRPGNVTYATESAGGKVAYLYADDGNVYYYAHMSQFQGSNRHVTTATVIGLVGQTGNATAPHLYFDVRIGNVNGVRIDPYPLLQAAHC